MNDECRRETLTTLKTQNNKAKKIESNKKGLKRKKEIKKRIRFVCYTYIIEIRTRKYSRETSVVINDDEDDGR